MVGTTLVCLRREPPHLPGQMMVNSASIGRHVAFMLPGCLIHLEGVKVPAIRMPAIIGAGGSCGRRILGARLLLRKKRPVECIAGVHCECCADCEPALILASSSSASMQRWIRITFALFAVALLSITLESRFSVLFAQGSRFL